MPSIHEIATIENTCRGALLSRERDETLFGDIERRAYSYRLESPTLSWYAGGIRWCLAGVLARSNGTSRHKSLWFRLALCSRMLPRSWTEYRRLRFPVTPRRSRDRVVQYVIIYTCTVEKIQFPFPKNSRSIPFPLFRSKCEDWKKSRCKNSRFKWRKLFSSLIMTRWKWSRSKLPAAFVADFETPGRFVGEARRTRPRWKRD